MRARGAGTIVTIASWAARNLAWFPGAAYNASKRALLALTETINLEVAGEGRSATVILPEAVDTPILGQRPGGLPPAEVRAKMLRPEDVAAAIVWVLPSHPMSASTSCRSARSPTTTTSGYAPSADRARATGSPGCEA